MSLSYRTIEDAAGFEQVSQLEQLVWGLDTRDVITPHIQRVIVHTGGVIYGAWDGERLAGCVVGLATHDPQRIWSHIAAVHPDYQRRGIGLALKRVQREWALQQGYTVMNWTMDPLMSANAHFNFGLLGAQASVYHVNFYGVAHDAINAGIPTDRLQVTWRLDQPATTFTPPDTIPAALSITGDDHPQTAPIDADAPLYRVEIPLDYAAIKQHNKPLALRWREQSAAVITHLFSENYVIIKFVREQHRHGWYLFSRNI